MGVVESDLCTFCNLTKEDIEHLFLVTRSLSYFGKTLSYVGRNVRILILI